MASLDRRLAASVYAMVLLAVFTMVWPTGELVYFAIASLAAMISWPIAHGQGRASAVPRWLISIAVLLALTFLLLELVDRPLMTALSHFMVFVQVCKFFERKRARDYAQLIVLSMLQMVIAAIVSSSIGFGVLLTVYLSLCIYTLLLFHFRREMETFESGRRVSRPPAGATAAAARAIEAISHWRIWRISATAGTLALVVGMMLFLVFPRVGEGLLSQWTPRPADPVTGFSSHSRLGEIGLIKENDQIAMRVAVSRAGQSGYQPATLLLRGSVLSAYRDGAWDGGRQVPRRRGRGAGQIESREIYPDQPWTLIGREPPPQDLLRLQITLEPIGVSQLFSTYPPVMISSGQDPFRVVFDRSTATLRGPGSTQPIAYSVWVPADDAAAARLADRFAAPAGPARDESGDMPELAKLAREWTQNQPPDEWPDAVARNLGARCSYSLEMKPPPPGVDPLVDFVTRTRSGHCEYFASAMTVMCQHLGLHARMVNGFKAMEYNRQGEYFIVRQRHAHSWVEVYQGSRGWVTYDPTPAGDNSFESPGGVLGWLANVFDSMNYQWQQRVMNYSGKDRHALLVQAELAADRTTWRVRAWARRTSRYLKRAGPAVIERLSSDRRLSSAVIAGLVASAAAMLLLRARIRPQARRQRLMRKRGLGFWADLLNLVDRFGVPASAALTPRELAGVLAARVGGPADLDHLADCYYQVRYGHTPLADPDRRRIADTLSRLNQSLKKSRTT